MCPRMLSDAGCPAGSPWVCSAGHKTGPRCTHLLFAAPPGHKIGPLCSHPTPAAPPGHKNGLPCARLPLAASHGHKNGLLCAHLLLGAGGKGMVSMSVLCRGGLPPAGGHHPQQRVPAARPGRRCENGVRPGGRAAPTTPEEAPAVTPVALQKPPPAALRTSGDLPRRPPEAVPDETMC